MLRWGSEEIYTRSGLFLIRKGDQRMTSESAITREEKKALTLANLGIIPTSLVMSYQMAYRNEKRPVRGVFAGGLAEQEGFEPSVGY